MGFRSAVPASSFLWALAAFAAWGAVSAADARVEPDIVGAGEPLSPESVRRQLLSAAVPYEPMPQWDGTPVLKALLEKGWALGAPLEATYRELSGPRGIACREVRFKSHDWGGKPVRIFGYYAYPKSRNGRVPGLLMVHGGGGYATLDRATEAAAQGYAALSIDLPGRGTLREGKSRSTGPAMTVHQLFTVKPDLRDNYIYNAVLAQLRAVSFLRTRPEVEPKRIGLIGVSWGGATGLITTSLDRRITCFVNIYGAGLLWDGSTWHEYLRKLPEGEFRLWEANFDPSRYVPDIRVPVLGVTGTNDNCYYLNRFLRTLRAIKPAPDLVLRPNLDHKIDDKARSSCFRWLGVKLKGDHAKAPPRLAAMKIEATTKGARVSVQAGGQVAVRGAEVCYGPVGDVGWTNREWRTVNGSPDRYATWWSADIPLPTQITYVFASVQFADGSLLSTPVHSVATAVIDSKKLALDVPFMYDGSFLVEAHALAGFIGGDVEVSPDGAVLLSRGDRQAHLNSHRLGDLCYVGLRDACEQLGGIVVFRDNKAQVSLPTLHNSPRPAGTRPPVNELSSAGA
ncbi:MAG: alpha/beta fold hydrolase [Armatimonadetes bacterium]|nr:alpha/beta fold hydrolase [Armatimonadota bacterium]